LAHKALHDLTPADFSNSTFCHSLPCHPYSTHLLLLPLYLKLFHLWSHCLEGSHAPLPVWVTPHSSDPTCKTSSSSLFLRWHTAGCPPPMILYHCTYLFLPTALVIICSYKLISCLPFLDYMIWQERKYVCLIYSSIDL
jgi:hypothetical protein